MNEEYPFWICADCAYSLGCPNRKTISCYHLGECGWCKKETAVTQPRDYGYPPFSNNKCDILPKRDKLNLC